jgi:hypothetical protein
MHVTGGSGSLAPLRALSRSRRLVSRSSAPVPGVYFSGENSSSLATSSTAKRSVYGNPSNTNVSSLMPFGVDDLMGAQHGGSSSQCCLRGIAARQARPRVARGDLRGGGNLPVLDDTVLSAQPRNDSFECTLGTTLAAESAFLLML